MRFMIMHKMTPEMEKGLPPQPEIVRGVGELIDEAMKAKRYVGGAGLKPSSQRVEVTYHGGERRVVDGPFAEAKELVAGFALMHVKSKEDALAWCDRFAKAFGGDVRLFMGPVMEPWDVGIMPKPQDPPLRYLSMHQLDARKDQCGEGPPDAAMMARMGALVQEMTKSGVLEATGGLMGTEKGARIHFENGKRTVIDGPFAESKELIAGYAMLDLPSKAAAIEWAMRFGEVTKVHEVEIRQMPEW